LRERKDDIHPLCRYFFDKYRQELGKPVDSISPEVVKILVEYDFPGNVRELEHIVERAVILADGTTIERKHLPFRFLEDLKSARSIGNPGRFQRWRSWKSVTSLKFSKPPRETNPKPRKSWASVAQRCGAN
jgi:transcriptional regulator with PAS, ATPase and Fis domain